MSERSGHFESVRQSLSHSFLPGRRLRLCPKSPRPFPFAILISREPIFPNSSSSGDKAPTRTPSAASTLFVHYFRDQRKREIKPIWDTQRHSLPVLMTTSGSRFSRASLDSDPRTFPPPRVLFFHHNSIGTATIKKSFIDRRSPCNLPYLQECSRWPGSTCCSPPFPSPWHSSPSGCSPSSCYGRCTAGAYRELNLLFFC